MKQFFLSAIIFLFGISGVLTAQNKGTIRGTVYDKELGETVPFANVFVESLSIGTTTDLDGKYELQVNPGIYNIKYTYIGYSDLMITDVEIVPGEIQVLDAQISEGSQVLEELVITARQSQDTDAALNTLKSKSVNMLDGISSQTFSRVGDGDAAAAIKRVPGVSVQEGKHVYVRGLGDRYTKTLLNDLDIPGLDPDRNSVQMDLFPTNLIDNILVYKTFTPDLPGDFSGGMVNINTKDFAEVETLEAGVSTEYNPTSHFNDQSVTYEGGDLDWLGFDDGTRKLPFNKNINIPDPSEDQQSLYNITNSFNPILSTMRKRMGLDQSYNLSYANQKSMGSADIGYTFAINYSADYQYYDNAEFNDYIFSTNPDLLKLDASRYTIGDIGEQSVLWSGLMGMALKYQKHKVRFNFFHSQNGVSRGGNLRTVDVEGNDAILLKNNLEYTQRSVSNFNLSGKHIFDQLTLNWSFAPTFSRIMDPDIRFSSYLVDDDGTLNLSPSAGATINRIWRNLNEQNYTGRIDAGYKLGSTKISTISGGLYGIYKNRDYEILNYLFRVQNESNYQWTGNHNELFYDENLWNPESDAGIYVIGNYEPANTYNARFRLIAAYSMHEYAITNKLKTIYGLRLEIADMWYTGQNNIGTEIYDQENVLSEVGILPSANLVYELRKRMNLRATYSRTVARPTFKEKSLAQILDRITGRFFVGNIKLAQSYIHNFDLRWEKFMDRGQLLSFSTFYKHFNDPIELATFSESSPNSFQPRNVDQAFAAGIEFEGRKALDFIGIPQIFLAANVTLVYAQTTMDSVEYLSRVNNARRGVSVDRERDMVGQSPYIINAGVNYLHPSGIYEANFSYNVQGERLAIIGLGRNMDVLEQPFHSLDAKVSVRFGGADKWKLSTSVKNILNDDKELLYDAPHASNIPFERFSPGREYSLGLSFKMP